MKTITIIALLLLTSCSANKHLSLSQWHLKRAIAKGAKVTSDSITRIDTLIVDTTVRLSLPPRKLEKTYLISWGERGLMPLSSKGDTGVSVRVEVVNDTLIVEANCDSVSGELHFYKELYSQCTTAVNNTIQCLCFAKTWRDIIVYVLSAFGAGMLVMGFIMILRK